MSNDRLEVRRGRNIQKVPEQIDLLQILHAMKKIFQKTWFWMCLLFVLVSVGVTGFQIFHYEQNYEAYVTIALSRNTNNTQDDQQLAARVSNSFRYLLSIDDFYAKLYSRVLGVAEEALSLNLTASYITDTNFVTIRAIAKDNVQANESINLILEEFRNMVNIVTGSYSYTVVERYQPEVSDITKEEDQMRLMKYSLYGLAAGLAVVLATLLLIACFSDAVRNYDDIRSQLDVHKVGDIPTIHGRMSLYGGERGLSFLNNRLPHYYRDSIYLALARIEKEMREKNMRTILISSSVPKEGKTTISCNLALAMAERGEKVLLIDADLRNPSVAQAMDIQNIPVSVSEILQGKAKMKDAVISLGESRPDFLVSKVSVGGTDDLLTSANMNELIEEARATYDYVIVDTPPAAMLMDAVIVAGYVDAAAYVVRQDYTRVRSIEEGIKLLEHSGVDVLGCIINCADGPASYGYGYGYNYGYGRKRKNNR